MNNHILTRNNYSRVNTGRQAGDDFRIPLWKRATDILFAIVGLLVLSPIFLLIAILIRVESKGKIVYASKRVGAGYKIFNFYKFRSMYMGADKNIDSLTISNQYSTGDFSSTKTGLDIAAPEHKILIGEEAEISEALYLQQKEIRQEQAFFKMANDPRITRVGRLIRNSSLDELPQLFNILKGDMSVVGNRPLPPYEAEMLTNDQWIKRFLAPAGLTGLWQVTKRGGSEKMSADERKQLDIDYATNFSFTGDLRIILKTFPALLQKENL